MAATDRNKSGKRTDYAKHYSLIATGSPVCGTKNYGYSTNDPNEVECERCTVWLLNVPGQYSNIVLPKIGMTDLYFQNINGNEEDYLSVEIPVGDYKVIGYWPGLTEEHAADIVYIGMDYYEPAYKNYVAEADSIFKYPFDTAKESFASLMQSLGCYSVNSEPNDCHDAERYVFDKWKEAEANTGTWVILIKL